MSLVRYAKMKAMQCNYCEKWMHSKCLNVKDADYKKYQDLKDGYWFCKEDERKIQNFMAEKKTESKLLKEIKDIHLELREFREEANKQKSFADVIRSASTPSLFKTSVVQPKISKAFGVIVRPKDSTIHQENTVEVVKRKIDLVKVGVGVTSIKPINNKGCFLGTTSERDSQKLNDEIKLKLGEKYEVTQPTTLKPQLFLTGVEREYEEEQLVTEIISTNYGFSKEDEIKVVHKRPMKTANQQNVSPKWLYVLEAKEVTFQKLVNKNIMIDFRHHYIREYINLIRCYNCQK